MFYEDRIDPSPQDKNTLETYQFEPTLNFWASRKKLALFERCFVSSKQDLFCRDKMVLHVSCLWKKCP